MAVYIDFSSAKEIVDGVYSVVVKSCKEDESAAGLPVIKLQLQVTDGEYTGQMIFSTLSLQAHALFGIRGFLKAIGLDTSEDLDFDPDEAVGAELEVTVKVTEEFGPGVKKFAAL